MARTGWIALAFLCLWAVAAAAAERGVVLVYDAQGEQAKSDPARTALVIGNSSYRRAPLRNPVNDATDVAEALKGLGFEVVLALDVNERVFKEALRKFYSRLQRRGGIGLFYYAGHGIQVRGRNYLVPVGADIEREADVEYEAVDAGQVLRYMDEAEARLNIVILDACRDNPYERSWRSASRGLVRIELPQGPLGSLLAYSTAPGKVAADGTGRNSPFTKHLLASFGTPGLDLEDVFKRTRIGVSRETAGQQIPWSESSLLGDFYFRRSPLAGAAPSLVEPQPPKRTPERAELTVRSNVTGDTLYIDGRALGPTGPNAHELAPGAHTIRVEKDGYTRYEAQINLEAGDSVVVRARLNRIAAAPPPPASVERESQTATKAKPLAEHRQICEQDCLKKKQLCQNQPGEASEVESQCRAEASARCEGVYDRCLSAAPIIGGLTSVESECAGEHERCEVKHRNACFREGCDKEASECLLACRL